MKENLNKNETTALTMHYYAYLNDQDVVETIVSLPSEISDLKYISIPTNDQSLIGKKYNRQTGKFEDIMFYYAVLDEKDMVIQVVALESKVTDEKKIEIATYDQSLVGKWYDRKNKIFCAPPIHVVSKMNTGEINTLKADGSPEDKWLHTELADIRTKILAEDQALYAELGKLKTQLSEGDTALYTELGKLRTQLSEVERGNFGGYKTYFKLKDNQQTTSEWIDGKRLTFYFDTGIPGYFPKMIRLTNDNGNNFLADLYIIKNPNGTIKRIYLDQNYIGIRRGSDDQIPKRYLNYDKNADSGGAFSVGHSDGKYYNEGGQYFIENLPKQDFNELSVGKFSYNENSISFTIDISEELVGRYTIINLRGYVY